MLESEPAPDVVAVFIDGLQRVMPEDRGFPRPMPRPGAAVRVAFGEPLDAEVAFGDLRKRWRDLVARSAAARDCVGGARGEDMPDVLRYGEEARALRMETAWRMREEVLKVRMRLGYPDSDPTLGHAETWGQAQKKPG